MLVIKENGGDPAVFDSLGPIEEELGLAAAVVSMIGTDEAYHVALNLSATAAQVSAIITLGAPGETNERADDLRHQLLAWLNDFQRQARQDLGVGETPDLKAGQAAFDSYVEKYGKLSEEPGVIGDE